MLLVVVTVCYSLVKALGTMRPDNSDSLMPVKHMPMGLIEYTVNFFTASISMLFTLYKETVVDSW